MKFLSRLFRRRPNSPADCRQMNEDWRLGDLAVCIDDDWEPKSTCSPQAGDLLRVSKISEGLWEAGNSLIVALGFEGKPAEEMWDCCCFRKVSPAAEPAEDEFTQYIKRFGELPPVSTPQRERA